MKKLLLSTFLLCASLGIASAQQQKTQDEQVTREEMNAIRKMGMEASKQGKDRVTVMDEEYKKLIAKKQAVLEEQAQKQIQAQEAEKAKQNLAQEKLQKKADQEANKAKLAVINKEYQKKYAELVNKLSKAKFENSAEKQKVFQEQETELKKSYAILFSEKN